MTKIPYIFIIIPFIIFPEAFAAKSESYVRTNNCERMASIINSHEVGWNILYHSKLEEFSKGSKISLEEVKEINNKIYDLEKKLQIKTSLYNDLCIDSKIPIKELP